MKRCISKFSNSWKEEIYTKEIGQNLKFEKNVKSYFSFNFKDVNNLFYCVFCKRTFLKGNMVPIKLQHHFGSNHSGFREKRIKYFICRRDKFFKSLLQEKLPYCIVWRSSHNSRETNNKVLHSSCWMPAGWEIRIGEPLSNNTVTCQVKGVSANTKTELMSHLKKCPFPYKWPHLYMRLDVLLACTHLALAPTNRRRSSVRVLGNTHTGLPKHSQCCITFSGSPGFSSTPVLTLVLMMHQQWRVTWLVP